MVVRKEHDHPPNPAETTNQLAIAGMRKRARDESTSLDFIMRPRGSISLGICGRGPLSMGGLFHYPSGRQFAVGLGSFCSFRKGN